MVSSDPQVDSYMKSVPREHRKTLDWLRRQSRRVLDGVASEHFESNMPVYKRGASWLAGFAWRKKGPMFYCMDPALLDEQAGRLGRLRSGKSCMEMTPTPALTDEDLKAIVLDILEAIRAKHGAETGPLSR